MVNWEKVWIKNDAGEEVEAIAPIIISASRSTDVPSCYSDWFAYRFFEKGYLAWVNPFNRCPIYVSFKKTRVIIFWTKDPTPIISHLDKLDQLGVNYYFQYTLNDYDDVVYEPNIPRLDDRINDFIALSKRIGKEKVIWRFDPILLSNRVDITSIISRIKKVGDKVFNHTNRMIFSFVDLKNYRKLTKPSIAEGFREPTIDETRLLAQKIGELNEKWGLDIFTCGEKDSFTDYGIRKGSCVDGDLIQSLFPNDVRLMAFLKNNNKKDSGQRESCGCIPSKDIGEYNTCPNLCRYCYANSSRSTVIKNIANHNKNRYGETITGMINYPKRNDESTQIKLML